MTTVSHREDPDPYGVHPLAADELRVGFNNNRPPRIECLAGPRLTGAGRARSVPRRRSCSITTNRRYRVAIRGTKGA